MSVIFIHVCTSHTMCMNNQIILKTEVDVDITKSCTSCINLESLWFQIFTLVMKETSALHPSGPESKACAMISTCGHHGRMLQ